MPKLLPDRIPKYRRHRASGQAVVTLSGVDHYLGPHGSRASRREYDRLVAEWISQGRRVPAKGTSDLTIVELAARYWGHCQNYYIKNGKPTSEQTYVKLALRRLRALYGRTPAADVGPLALAAVRQAMIDEGLAWTVVNGCLARIKRLFRWAVAQELVPPSVHHGLRAVPGIRRDRCPANCRTEPVKPVPEEYVEAVTPYVSVQVSAMIQLQRLAGLRSTEVTDMRQNEIDMTGRLWFYRPGSHKTEHHGHERIIELGPRAQVVIQPFLRAQFDGYLFSPREAESDRNARKRAGRKSQMTPSQAARRPKSRPKCAPGDHYTRNSYRAAIQRACDKADLAAKEAEGLPADGERIVPRWHPHQLRHNFATRMRKEYGIETARVLLGHSSIVTTEVYAEADRARASAIMLEVG